MFPPHDAPLSSGQRLALLIDTLFFPVLLAHAAAFLWFRDTHPQRARSFAWVGATFLQGVLLMILLGLAFSFLIGRLAGP